MCHTKPTLSLKSCTHHYIATRVTRMYHSQIIEQFKYVGCHREECRICHRFDFHLDQHVEVFQYGIIPSHFHHTQFALDQMFPCYMKTIVVMQYQLKVHAQIHQEPTRSKNSPILHVILAMYFLTLPLIKPTMKWTSKANC